MVERQQPAEFPNMKYIHWPRRNEMTRRPGTHIDTLADDSAKSRRRVRRTLGLKAGIPVGPLQAAYAQEKAELRERHHPAKGGDS